MILPIPGFPTTRSRDDKSSQTPVRPLRASGSTSNRNLVNECYRLFSEVIGRAPGYGVISNTEPKVVVPSPAVVP